MSLRRRDLGIAGACLLATLVAACAAQAKPRAARVAVTRAPRFGRTACSPQLAPGVAQGLVVAMPARITWGDPLPVCGHLRIGEELRLSYPGFDFALARKDDPLEAYRGNGSHELGAPQMDRFSPAREILQRTGELYFTVDGQHEYRDLSPGAYEITIGYLGQLTTAPHHLEVVAGGWRLRLADALVDAVCARGLLTDLADYLGLMHQASLVDLDEAGQAAMERQLAAAWRKGMSPAAAARLLGRHRADLRALPSQDTSIPLYAYPRIAATCPRQRAEVGQLLNVFAGLRTREVAARR